ncbi:glyoxylase-like metal-dependent hydrolase (beta-lactamase superfamily II) [Methylobacterium brachiatum]|uniref:Glyoxylase-like metal-dependent hydrolase (Beta-lactamase superfamily II) n=1 Tax=Methylobacterium brachiatum TaxID=269660 RepID=A0AAJ1WUF8_9HYPH|nr:MBL fold metallo-hydrolase [Methylobacterium brachiatum]MCB4800674.1 MBL fold metallo-hydrolase [Methylobacterium brachiatum]MDQ0541570.1 glyoxylase-like metal-dependent hydrolase (beta-lactamase superfamily II) [Methylobacterium brachiatum]
MPGTPRAGIIPVTPFQQNCTLIWDDATKVGAVVDPGGDLDRIEAAIREQGVRVEKILLTHGHVDHAAGADELRERLGVPIEGPHLADKFLLDSLPETAANYGIGEGRALTPDRWLDDGDAVTVGELGFDILHCPGHSPGSVVFVSRDARFALVGDVVFKGSVGRTDLPGGNHEQLIRAIKEKVLPLGDDIAFIPGHGPTGTLGEERVSNPFLQG